jgi:hypothetical protein
MPQAPAPDQAPAPQDNDALIAAGQMFRYSRNCPCGRALPGFNELPGPKHCDPCLAAEAARAAAPSEPG